MRKLALFVFLLLPLFINAQDTTYQIRSFFNEGIKAPNTHHLGEAWLNFLMKADDDFNYNITQATFSANATLDWHKHKSAQVIIIIEGEAYYQERGEEPVILRKGDVVKCKKDTEHWHTSTANSKVSYLAIYGKEPTIWTEKLSREYYNRVAEKLKNK